MQLSAQAEAQLELQAVYAKGEALPVPFEFNSFPILVKGTDIFKVRGDTNEPYVDIRPVSQQLARIRRDGNWPKELLRKENLEDRIMMYLLNSLDHDADLPYYGDTYFYMFDPTGVVQDPVTFFFSFNQDPETKPWALAPLYDNSQTIKFGQ